MLYVLALCKSPKTYNKCQLSRALSSDIFFFELIGVSWGAKGPMIPHYTPLPSSSSSGFFLQGSEGACRRTPAGPLGGLGRSVLEFLVRGQLVEGI